MEDIFKVGDKVFCYNLRGWGEVIKIFNDDNPFPVYCSFELGNSSFTKDGKFYSEAPPILSFTEYTLEGFSQERPEDLPKKGDIVWVRDWEEQSWTIAHFIQKSNGGYYVTHKDPNSNHLNGNTYKLLTTKNPYANEHN